MVVQQHSLPSLALYPQLRVQQVSSDSKMAEPALEEIRYVIRLLAFGQVLCEQLNDGLKYLCQEIQAITEGGVQLCLGNQHSSKKMHLPANTMLTLPLQFGQLAYGKLCVMVDDKQPDRPVLSQTGAELLAQVCSWLLYTIEQSTFLQGQCQQLDYHVHGPLTRREQEVLSLMCRGYNQEGIASLLCIAPATVGKHRQHIYEQLGVHCERDALLAAYHVGLFSLVE
ncbi:MAG: LuxR C-terminal-related transcriptional regulator [Ktedonobacteraceae bacterium]